MDKSDIIYKDSTLLITVNGKQISLVEEIERLQERIRKLESQIHERY